MHTRALERFEVVDCGPPVAGSAGDHDRTGTHTFSVGQLQHKAAIVRIPHGVQADHLIGDGHLHAEFLGLIVGTCHQGHASDPGREAQVILDPGGGASLTTKCATVQHEYGEAFRPCVDSGGETRGPGTHDDNVIDTVRIDRPYQSDATRELDLSWITQELPAGA